MTKQEAKKILGYISCSNNECPPVDCDECHCHVTAKQLDEAFQMTLEALQETEQPDHIAEANKKDDENGDDLIRREDALMSLTGEWTESRDEILSKAIRRIKRLPSAQPEQKKGKWINKKPRWIGSISMTVQDAYECSNCGEAGVNWWRYCTYCGKPMEIDGWRKPIIERWRSENERFN